MKITRRHLQRLIREELSRLNEQDTSSYDTGYKDGLACGHSRTACEPPSDSQHNDNAYMKGFKDGVGSALGVDPGDQSFISFMTDLYRLPDWARPVGGISVLPDLPRDEDGDIAWSEMLPSW